MTLADYAHAARALARNAHLLAASRPATPLRVLCIAALDYVAARRGGAFPPERKRALAVGLDLGALLNDHFDEGRFAVGEYRALRRELGRDPHDRAAFRLYLAGLAAAERGRPRPLERGFGEPAAVIAYRRRVLTVSLDFVWALSRGGAAGAGDDPLYRALLSILDLLQLIDDLWDWPNDHAARLPTHLTAYACPAASAHGDPAERLSQLIDEADARVADAARGRAEVDPVRLAGQLIRAIARGLVRLRTASLRSAQAGDPGAPEAWSGLLVGEGGALRVRRERVGAEPRARLLFASDLHLRAGNGAAVSSRLLAAVRPERPDAILLGGDLVDTPWGLEPLRALVAALVRVAPVAAIDGNHDRLIGADRVREAVLAGGGSWLPDGPLAVGALALHGESATGAVAPPGSVLCAHYPTVFDRACADGVRLVLSGHLHGGQFVLGERGGLLYPGALVYAYNGLRFERGVTTMLVSRGVHDTLPLRWNCPREVLLVEL